jgi:hypothetical protein
MFRLPADFAMPQIDAFSFVDLSALKQVTIADLEPAMPVVEADAVAGAGFATASFAGWASGPGSSSASGSAFAFTGDGGVSFASASGSASGPSQGAFAWDVDSFGL